MKRKEGKIGRKGGGGGEGGSFLEGLTGIGVVVCMAAAASPAVAIINQEGSQPSVGWSATSNACEEFGARKRI